MRRPLVALVALAAAARVAGKILLTLQASDESGEAEYEITGLHEAAAEGQLDVLDELLDRESCHGMPPTCPDACFACFYYEDRPCTKTPKFCKRQCDRHLVCASEWVDHFDATGSAALHWAAARCNLFAVKALLHAGATVNLTSASVPDRKHADVKVHFGTMPPLAAAATFGCGAVIDELLAAGADVDGADATTGNTALLLGVARGHVHVVEKLLRAGADPNARSQGLTTPLMAAAKGPGASDRGLEDVPSNPELVKLLIEAGADLDAQDGMNEMSALMYAAHAGSLKAVRLLVDAGASIDVRSAEGEDGESYAAADWARFAGHTRIARELKSLQATAAFTKNVLKGDL